MARALLQQFWGRGINTKNTQPMLEVDWSVISGEGLGLMFKAILADLVGAPAPRELLEAQKSSHYGRQAWRRASVEDVYVRSNLATGLMRGFLIRGVVYDMQSLTKARQPASDKGTLSSPDLSGRQAARPRDWMSLVDESISKEDENATSGAAKISMQTADVLDKMGLKSTIPGLASRVQGEQSKATRKPKLEDFVGKAAGIRAKYAEKIRTKKILADVRREQRELGIVYDPATMSSGSNKGWQVAPGSPVIVRYLQARGLLQSLIARGGEDDLDSFLEQLGNFEFRPIYRELLKDNPLRSGKLDPSSKILSAICSKWGFRANQILLVLGEGPGSRGLIKEAGKMGFFVCVVKGAQFGDAEDLSTSPSSLTGISEDSSQHKPSANTLRAVRSVKAELRRNSGLRTWFTRLATGTLDADDQVQVIADNGIHFTVADMIELKWVVEDLNGVSYRKNTMIRGFEELVRQT